MHVRLCVFFPSAKGYLLLRSANATALTFFAGPCYRSSTYVEVVIVVVDAHTVYTAHLVQYTIREYLSLRRIALLLPLCVLVVFLDCATKPCFTSCSSVQHSASVSALPGSRRTPCQRPSTT